MNKIQTDLAQIITATKTLADFVAKYGDALSDNLVTISCSDNPFCRIDLNYADQSNTDRALAVAGEVFGRVGWTAKQSPYGENHINWIRVIDGVTVQIDGAEKLPPIAEHAVDPKAFPLMLENSEEVTP